MSGSDDHGSGDEWGPWVVHDGKGCPLLAGVIVEVVSVDGFGFAMRAVSTVSGETPSSWNWDNYPELRKIIRYRARKPRGLRILEKALREAKVPKAPVKVD